MFQILKGHPIAEEKNLFIFRVTYWGQKHKRLYSKSDTKILLERIRNEDDELVKEIYLQYRREFQLWMSKNFGLPEGESDEYYHESFLAFINNTKSGKLTELTSSLKTYLFSIGKNKYMENRRKAARSEEFKVSAAEVPEESTYDENLVLMMEKGLSDLGSNCRRLLKLFYYQKKSMKEIMSLMEYKNTGSAKNQKYKCLKRLQEIIKDKL